MLKKLILIILFIVVVVVIAAALFMQHKGKSEPTFIRSITAIRLKTVNPVEKKKLTGMVEPWKEEDLSFEVSGRIQQMIDKGSDVQGGKNAYSLSNGDGGLIATLDPLEYQLRLKAAEANVNTTRAKLNALKISIKEVISRQLEAVKADMDNAEKEFNRFKGLLQKNVISQKIFDTAETALKKYQAKYFEVKALITVKQADVKALEASLEQLIQLAADAKLDLERTKLKAPYQGKIADIYANIGANVRAGEKVAKLVVVDPVVVDLNISAALDRKLHYTQFVKVYPPDSNQPVPAMINKKAAIADPNTHTFSLELLVRNRFINIEKNIPSDLLKLPEIKGVWPIAKINLQGSEKLVVLSKCIYNDGEGDFLWKVTETKNTLPGAPVYKVKKVQATFLPGEHSFFGAYKYRIFDNPDGMNVLDFVATGVPETVKTGEEVILIRRQRMFRSGNLVKVLLSIEQTKSGFYIPLTLISSNTLKQWVFKVVKQKDGSTIAKQVFIKPKGLFNDWVLVESPQLKEGDLIVYNGAHFLIPNEKINVKSIEKVVL